MDPPPRPASALATINLASRQQKDQTQGRSNVRFDRGTVAANSRENSHDHDGGKQRRFPADHIGETAGKRCNDSL